MSGVCQVAGLMTGALLWLATGVLGEGGGSRMAASEYWVAPTGDDANPGTRARPFGSPQRAAAATRPGDTCWLRAGRYQPPLVLRGVKGTEDRPITFRVWPGEEAVVDGTEALPGPWVRHKGAVHRTTVERDVWQLFVGEEMVQPARWPNASLADGDIWDMAACMRCTDRGYHWRSRQYTGGTEPGVIFDRNPPSEAMRGAVNQETLAETGIDFSGAVAMLNIGHWLTWARPVLRHEAGSDHFTYDPTGTEMRKTCNYYLLGLQCLDRENEWWFDHRSRTVYLWAPGGADPNGLQVRGKVRDHCVEAVECEHVHFSGVRFFGGGPWVVNSTGITFEDCVFHYPTENKVVLGVYDWFRPGRRGDEHNSMFTFSGGRDNVLRNCEAAYVNSPVYLGSDGMLVENCLFHHIEWDVLSSGGSGSVWIGQNAVARRNTIHTAGNSEGLRPQRSGATIELNRLWNMGLLQHDGAAINVGNNTQPGCVARRNWAHDCNRQGIRFDYGGPDAPDDDPGPPPAVTDGVYAHNVIWSCRSNQVKGNRHLVYNNTAFNSFRIGVREPNPLCDIGLSGFRYMHNFAFNEQTIARNNMAALAARSWALRDPEGRRLPGVHDHNLNEPDAALKHLRDPADLDFRPRPDSPAVDGGAVIAPHEVTGEKVRFTPMTYEGAAPDIGAYEHGAASYWIPGRRERRACSPVPPDGSTTVRPDADVMFLGAYRAHRHIVYLGTAPDKLERRAELTETNILSPGRLTPGRTYHWRVDAVLPDGEVIEGPTWRFTVE